MDHQDPYQIDFELVQTNTIIYSVPFVKLKGQNVFLILLEVKCS